MKKIHNWMFCTSCSHILDYNLKCIPIYFYDEKMICESCGEKHDLFSIISKNIEDNFMLNSAFGFIGANTNIFFIYLYKGKITTYKRSEHGIPIGSKILYVNYSPGGSLFPTELHGNIISNSKHYDEIAVYPVPLGEDEEIKEPVEVNVMTTWIEKNKNIDSMNCIVDAFISYSDNDYTSMVIPANSAVEYVLSKFLSNFLENYCSKKNIDNFFKDAATYSHQLNVILPLICKLKNLPLISDELRGALNNLRRLRNNVAHTGHMEKEINKKDAAMLLTASLFAYKYVLLIEELASAA